MKTATEGGSFRTAGSLASTMKPEESVISHKKLNSTDITVLIVYFIFVILVGLWAMYKTKRSTVKGYFLAGRNMTWCPIGASLFASNVGSGHFIGLAGSGASSGIAVSVYEWSGMYCLILLAWLFLPIYIASGVTTMPEYLLKRFGGQRIHFLIAILSLFAYIFTKISVDIYAGALFIHLALHWDLYLAVISLLIITAVYTVGDLVACTDADTCRRVCGNPAGCTDIAYPLLVMELLPEGLRGLMVAVMIAALMSSLTSIFNSASTLFTMDIWHHIRPHCSEWELMIVGRIFSLILVVVSVLWIPLVQSSQSGKLFMYIQSITSYLTPPIVVVFVAGCFWKRANEKGAFWSLTAGFLVGVIRMVLDFVFIAPACGEEDKRPSIISKVHFLHFALILALLTMLVLVVLSLLNPPPQPEQISRLTWYTRHDKLPEKPPEETVVMDDTAPSAEDTSDKMDTTEELSPRAGEKTESKAKLLLMWFCGMNTKRVDTAFTEVEENYIVSLQENKQMSYFVNVNLVICLTAAIFLYAYFA
ncbi:sodium/myo-inositol cotransporter 2-like isoform X3 [Hemitrygon akajei]|uniref:sodium/myo-inositol cotransporter 2-like isoform X3 n=1 Tax=Hemitrygon akajei TaxID=2704970 RepID=UPI003BFA2EA3